jgi:hypothetical protein
MVHVNANPTTLAMTVAVVKTSLATLSVDVKVAMAQPSLTVLAVVNTQP